MNLRLLLPGAMALFALGAATPVSPPALLPPAEAVRAGTELVSELLARRPAPSTNEGVMTIRVHRKITEFPIRFEVIVGEATWSNVYAARPSENGPRCTIVHTAGQPSEYRLVQEGKSQTLKGNQAMIPFAGSDFWLADLGLEFLRWKEQRVLKREMKRGQACNVLESVNPNPAPGAYSRVVSWVDIDTGGIMNADAYDAKGKRLKQFAATDFKKISGQWELHEIEMLNVQTDSLTRIRFDLKSN